MSSFANDIKALKEKAEATPVCSLGRYLRDFPEDDRQLLEYALARAAQEIEDGVKNAHRVFSNSTISNILRKNGHPMTKETVGKHLEGKCVCVS